MVSKTTSALHRESDCKFRRGTGNYRTVRNRKDLVTQNDRRPSDTTIRISSGLRGYISAEATERYDWIYPSEDGLVRHSSVWANVMLGSRAGNTKSHSREQSTNAILAMGLEEKRNEPIKRLSGGQQRRVAIARTLAQRPKLILADEFLSELDEETSDRVVKAVMQYVSSSGAAMVLVEHDISRAREISDRLLVIDDGRLNPFITDTSIMEVRS